MDGSSPPQTGAEHQPTPCASCRGLDCHSIHGQAPVRKECPEACYFCADLARIDDEISSTYKRLADLVQERKKVIAKPNHTTLIHLMPVEILSSIFLFLKDAIINVRFLENTDYGDPQMFQYPDNQQPCQSPPLLVGAVCKRWRDITLTMPHLWTDIIINLDKCLDGQFNMVEAWARRSAALPLNISVAQSLYYIEDSEEDPNTYENVLQALRALTDRWHDILLDVPAWFFHRLLNNIQEAPHVRLVYQARFYTDPTPLEMQNPLHPRWLVFPYFYSAVMPLEWDRLVFLNIRESTSHEIVHVIQSAQNLQICMAYGYGLDGNILPMPTTNRSLIYLKTDCYILGYLTLPNLSHLEYSISVNHDHEINSLAEFIGRSCPPLTDFTLRYYADGRGPNSSFEHLPEITSLFLLPGRTPDFAGLDIFLKTLTLPSGNVILPRLKELYLSFSHPEFWASSWSLIGDLFPKDTQKYPADTETIPDVSIGPKRPLSKVTVRLNNRRDAAQPIMQKDTFLRLLAIRKTGVNLISKDNFTVNLFQSMAEVYGIEP